jgi:hypothetical protein
VFGNLLGYWVLLFLAFSWLSLTFSSVCKIPLCIFCSADMVVTNSLVFFFLSFCGRFSFLLQLEIVVLLGRLV